jgi:hypothetical protein
MTITYEKYTSINGNEYIRRFNEDGSYSDIPMDEANSDYQRYLNPKAEQSTPIVIDEPVKSK